MKESVIYQEIESQGRQKGRQEGKLEGRQEEGLSFVFRLLNRRIGLISPSLEKKVRQLPLNTLEDLGEALLDFHSENDLSNWLETHV